ncbi:hypothetical protein AB0K60_12805 [Thermopolyspora sp. NPDC052614]|uniref:hypothetical protein n=1 Tax=Thermopolyspora sp. NPDC052614 TaxID=3155682 RepID=UPI00342C2041
MTSWLTGADIAQPGLREAVAQAHHAGLAAVLRPPETFPRALCPLERVGLRAIRALLAAEGALPPGGPAKAAEEVVVEEGVL